MDTSATDLTLEVRRTYKATPARVYAAWSKAEALAAWFAPTAEMTTLVHELDVRIGGRYRIEMRAPDGTAHIVRGTYREVVPDRRLVLTWMWEGQEQEESLVEVDLLSVGSDATELVLRHTGFATAASRQGHADGWGACLSRLTDAAAA